MFLFSRNRSQSKILLLVTHLRPIAVHERNSSLLCLLPELYLESFID